MRELFRYFPRVYLRSPVSARVYDRLVVFVVNRYPRKPAIEPKMRRSDPDSSVFH